MRQILFIWFAFWMVACTPSGKHSLVGEISSDTIHYAQGFTIRHFDDYISVEVRDPWDSTRLLQRYLLVDRNKTVPENLPKGTVVQIPVRNIVVYTSVHAAIIDQLQETDKIIGVCEPRYMDTPSIREGLKAGRIADMGEATSPNVEKMIDVGAELVIVSPFQNSSYGPVEKLGIPIIEGADYMESSPLGRTEWGRFYGMLFGKERMADSIFRDTEERYLALKELVAKETHRPTVISEKKFGSSWFVPSGESYMATLYNDAGADYLFKDLSGAGSTPLAFETVLDKGIHADLWLLKYNQEKEMTYNDLRTEYTPYENFDAFKNRRIYSCNTGVVPYYEEFPLHPDYLLKDLIWVFHPELLPDYTPRYYKKMTE
ncbi:ABC transporter substrate-binding protein [Parabacteroides sp. AM08-6]|nr:ABC transporter substrate-binding protein [Parabacteroides sp. AM08-6]RHJ86618.1 ABC transporter substrate-binding protein [Parabacteroides sp. AM08-6]